MTRVVSEVERFVNRTALLMVLSACCFLASVIAIPVVFQGTEDPMARLAAGAPILVGLGLGSWARTLRNRLWAASGRKP